MRSSACLRLAASMLGSAANWRRLIAWPKAPERIWFIAAAFLSSGVESSALSTLGIWTAVQWAEKSRGVKAWSM